jgi:hypothetical protein
MAQYLPNDQYYQNRYACENCDFSGTYCAFHWGTTMVMIGQDRQGNDRTAERPALICPRCGKPRWCHRSCAGRR